MAENGVTSKQTKAITALLAEKTIGEAAKQTGIGERTLSRWLTGDECFRVALRQAQDQAIDRAVTRLAGAAANAVNVLDTIVNDDNEKSSIRVAAAKAILDNTLKWSELHDLARRISELEQAING